MRLKIFRLVALCSVLTAVGAMPLTGYAQPYPAKPVRIIVAFPPGTGVDILARLVGQKLGERWSQPVVIDNRPGAGGSIGTGVAAKSPADGYTITMGNLGTHALNASLYKQLPYHPIDDFAAIAHVADVPMMMVVHPALPVKNVREFVALAKAQPAALNYGSAGVGAVGHLSGELLANLAGIRIVHIAYKGNQQALTDLMVGQVQLAFGNLLSYLPHAKSGRVKGLAVSTSQRSPSAPDLPTMIEAGVPGYEVAQWYGVFAPARTSGGIAEKLHADIAATLKAPDVRERLANDGAAVSSASREQFAVMVKKENERWRDVIRRANIQSQ